MAEAAEAQQQTVLDVLYEWARVQKDQTIWSFLDDKGKVVDRVTYGELLGQAQALATHLLASGVQPGDRVMLVFFPSLQFTICLIGCFMAGVIAVPVFPPDPRRLRKDLNHFASIQQSSGSRVALTQATYNYAKKMTDIKNVFSRNPGDAQWPELRWIVVDPILSAAKAADMSSLPRPSATDIAFLQYTSGSTSDPKGVMIAHENLFHNLNLIVRDLQADQSTVVVSWLPQYHDMGLIGSYLGILRCGGCGYYMSPFSFLKNPLVWLQSIAAYRGTHVQAPNFAYALTVRKFKEYSARSSSRLDYDLSSLRHMINAAEPVDEATIDNFYATFRPFGLPDGVLYPTYGLAEHCVFVCSGGSQRLCVQKSVLETEHRIVEVPRGSDDSNIIVGCGFPFRGEQVQLLVVNNETNEVLADDTVGEIWLDSPSKAKGYWGLDEQTQQDFAAQPASAEHHTATGYLRTGDLGFLHNGELFICGRLKDLIIVRGSNHYPQDLERTAETSNAGIRPGCSAAFQVSDNSEKVVLIAELRDEVKAQEYDVIIDGIRSAVATGHGVALAAIVLLETRSIPKTTSGKVARTWCRRAYVGGALKSLQSWQATTHDDADLLAQEEDGEAAEGGAAPNTCQPNPVAIESVLDAAAIQAMSDEQLAATIEQDLVQVTSYAGQLPLDRNTPLLALGLDSLSLGQFKGLLEGRYGAQVSDEWMFSDFATLTEMCVLVRNGSLTEAQQQALTESLTAGPDQQQQANSPGAVVAGQKQPCCPWFTCCY